MSEKWSAVIDAGRDLILDQIGPALEGAEGDLKAWGQKILQDTAEAVIAQDQRVLGNLLDQVKTVAGLNSIRLARGFTWESIGSTVLTIAKFVAKLAVLL